ncbi:MAG: hypothetical protein ACJ8G7_15255, partial [Rhizobacter sp.]
MPWRDSHSADSWPLPLQLAYAPPANTSIAGLALSVPAFGGKCSRIEGCARPGHSGTSSVAGKDVGGGAGTAVCGARLFLSSRIYLLIAWFMDRL